MKMFNGFTPSPGFTSNATLVGYSYVPMPFETYILNNYSSELQTLIAGGSLVDVGPNNNPVWISGTYPTISLNDQQGNNNKALFFSGISVGTPVGSASFQTTMIWCKCLDVVTNFQGIIAISGLTTKTGSNYQDVLAISDADGRYGGVGYDLTGQYGFQRLLPAYDMTGWCLWTIVHGSTYWIHQNDTNIFSMNAYLAVNGCLSGNVLIAKLNQFAGTTLNGSLIVGGIAHWSTGLTLTQVTDIWNNTKA